MAMDNWFLNRCAGAALLLCALASPAAWAREGVEVGERSVFADMVSAEQVEQQAALQYQQTLKAAADQRALGPADNAQVRRLRASAQKITPLANEWNERARQWKWEVNLIGSNQINAFCMPGGKIVFYTGILNTLQLSDDEVAMVMGHEIAHALQEHAREQMGKSMATRGVLEIGAALLGLGNGARMLGDLGAQLLSLKFGRDDETQADRIGLVLGARAGYAPKAGITLWEKMSSANKGAPPQFLSTHPSSPNRIQDIRTALARVEPLYERAPKPARRFEPAQPRASKQG